MSKETRQALRNEMDELENLIPGLNGLNFQEQPSPIEQPMIRQTNFAQIIDDCDREAEKIVKNTALFYLTQEEISSDRYLMDKLVMDTMEISNLMFQSRSAKLTYVRLLEEIDGGNVHPRIFEVQSGLQKSMMEITKSKTAYIHVMENSWRNVRQELQLKNAVQIGDGEEFSSTSLKARGTRDFLKGIQDEIKAENGGSENFVIPVIHDDELNTSEE
jgi:hypothetical protein